MTAERNTHRSLIKKVGLYFTDNDVLRGRDRALLRGAHAITGLALLGSAGLLGYSLTHGGAELFPHDISLASGIGFISLSFEVARALPVKGVLRRQFFDEL